MEKHRNKFIVIFLAAAILTIAGLALIASQTIQNQMPVKNDYASAKTELPPENDLLNYPSPDGSYTLAVENVKDASGIIHQTFSIKDDEDINTVIYKKDSNSKNIISVPDNTFSPNHKYIFLTYEESGETRYIVLRTDGENIKENIKTVEISAIFYEKYPDFVVTDVTGWGGYGLVVVNTNTSDGEIGPSWWFDLSNLSFIRLSTRFN